MLEIKFQYCAELRKTFIHICRGISVSPQAAVPTPTVQIIRHLATPRPTSYKPDLLCIFGESDVLALLNSSLLPSLLLQLIPPTSTRSHFPSQRTCSESFRRLCLTWIFNMIYPSHWVLLACVSAAIAQPGTDCAVKGYDKSGLSTAIPPGVPAYIVNTTISTPAACKNLCTASTPQKCLSFAVQASPPRCDLYNVTTASNFVPQNTSTYTFYDATCPVA